jgi:hypothetical protein
MRGFGFSFDLDSGMSRAWYIDKHGVKRWHNDDSVVIRQLPFDVARCEGVGSEKEGWREGCDICMRRLSPGDPERQAYMEPPEIIVFECERLIGA